MDGWKTQYGQYFIGAKGSVEWKWDAISQQLMGLVLARQAAYAVGRPASLDPETPCEFWVHGLKDGKKTHKLAIEGEPAYDGLSAAGGKLCLSTMQGTVHCLGE